MREYVLQTDKSIRLAEAIRKVRPDFAMPCGGKGTCGKCAVLVKGDLAPIDAEETALLEQTSKPEAPAGYCWRLACHADLLCSCSLMLDAPDEALTQLTSIKTPCAAAVDIGTTTVCYRIYDSKTRSLLFSDSVYSRQAGFGADVVSRIDYANTHGVKPLTQAILRQLNELIGSLPLDSMVITGNTTMLHLFAGLPPKSLGVAPFTPVSLFGRLLPFKKTEAYLPACISTYVGADITCGILATELTKENKNRLLVDVGTNGEMALCADGRRLCCATAAGPAFEGAQISMGMPFKQGAIDKAEWANDRLHCRVIGNGPALGLCGTGLISVIFRLLEHDLIDETGRLAIDPFPLGDSGVFISQQDVRNVQLAKAAIRAGIETLLHEAALTYKDIDTLLLCGGFGASLNPHEAAGIGLIPLELAGKTVAAGNAALEGAARLLFDSAAREEARQIAASFTEISLSSSPYFSERYIDEMMFE